MLMYTQRNKERKKKKGSSSSNNAVMIAINISKFGLERHFT